MKLNKQQITLSILSFFAFVGAVYYSLICLITIVHLLKSNGIVNNCFTSGEFSIYLFLSLMFICFFVYLTIKFTINFYKKNNISKKTFVNFIIIGSILFLLLITFVCVLLKTNNDVLIELQAKLSTSQYNEYLNLTKNQSLQFILFFIIYILNYISFVFASISSYKIGKN